jgi:UPF0716 protein FxsA
MGILLILGLLAVPVLEIYVLIQVGTQLGVLETVLLLLLVSVAGAWLMKREGRRVWRSLREALDAGRMPNRELLDGVLVLAGGALLLLPGFVSDVVGLLLVLPFTRPLARGLVAWLAARRVQAAVRRMGPAAAAPGQPGLPPRAGGRVVIGQVVDDDPSAGPRP